MMIEPYKLKQEYLITGKLVKNHCQHTYKYVMKYVSLSTLFLIRLQWL